VMRHSSYSTTADTYTHVMPAHSAEAVRTVAALFEGSSRLALPPTTAPQTRRERPDRLLAKPDRAGSPSWETMIAASYGRCGVVRGCPPGTGQDCCEMAR
jgi:hypothetical protein